MKPQRPGHDRSPSVWLKSKMPFMTEARDEMLVEMTFRWADIETGITTWARNVGKENEEPIGEVVAPAPSRAFRVEANMSRRIPISTGNLGFGTATTYCLTSRTRRPGKRRS